jgi:hypothetical protein
MSYRIVRFFADKRRKPKIITRGWTLEGARAHCTNPETSSRTCKLPENLAYTKRVGGWFDGYEKQ